MTRRIVTVRRVVISVLLAFALALLVAGFNSSRDTTAPTVRDQAVERTWPGPGDLDLRQSRIGIDLVSGYTAELQLDTVPIPDDQVEKVVGLDQYFYTPGPGTETGALSPGRHCATATIRVVGAAATDTGRKFSWCFNLH